MLQSLFNFGFFKLKLVVMVSQGSEIMNMIKMGHGEIILHIPLRYLDLRPMKS
jgi:hypothetical protein